MAKQPKRLTRAQKIENSKFERNLLNDIGKHLGVSYEEACGIPQRRLSDDLNQIADQNGLDRLG